MEEFDGKKDTMGRICDKKDVCMFLYDIHVQLTAMVIWESHLSNM